MIAAASPQHFLGIDPDGQTCIVKTTGNPYAHIVLRGGSRPNYDTVSIEEARSMLAAKGLTKAINGGYIGLEDRISHTEHALHILGA